MATIESRIRWGVAVAVALTVVGLLSLLFRPPQPIPPSGQVVEGPPPVQMARPTTADVVLKDEALVRDLRPLFLPTEFNTTLAAPRREPGRSILDDEPAGLGSAEAELGISRNLPPVALLNTLPAEKARARDVLAFADAGTGLVGFGRAGGVVTALQHRGGYLEVVAVSTGQRVLAEPLPPSLGPTGNREWEPMVLMAAVDAAGLASPLVVTESSHLEEVDAHFRKILAWKFRIGERLAPGFYRIVVGP